MRGEGDIDCQTEPSGESPMLSATLSATATPASNDMAQASSESSWIREVNMTFFQRALTYALNRVLVRVRSKDFSEDSEGFALTDVYLFVSDRLREISKLLSQWLAVMGISKIRCSSGNQSVESATKALFEAAEWYIQLARLHIILGLDALSGHFVVGIDPKLVRSAATSASRSALDRILDFFTMPATSFQAEHADQAAMILTEAFTLLNILSLPLGLFTPADLLTDVNEPPYCSPSNVSGTIAQYLELRGLIDGRLRSRNINISRRVWQSPTISYLNSILGSLERGHLVPLFGLDPCFKLYINHPCKQSALPFSVVSLISASLATWATARTAVALSSSAMPRSTTSAKDLAERLRLWRESLAVFLTVRVLRWPLALSESTTPAKDGLTSQLETLLAECRSKAGSSDTVHEQELIDQSVQDFAFPPAVRSLGWVARVEHLEPEPDEPRPRGRGPNANLETKDDKESSGNLATAIGTPGFCDLKLRVSPQFFGATGGGTQVCDQLTMFAYLRALSIARWRMRLQHFRTKQKTPETTVPYSFVELLQFLVRTGTVGVSEVPE